MKLNLRLVILISVFICSITLKVSAQEYEKEYGPTNGYYLVKKDGKWGYLNERRKVVIPIEYDDAFEFNDSRLALVVKNGKYGLITSFDSLYLPVIYDNIIPSKNESYVFIIKMGELFGLFNALYDPMIVHQPKFNLMYAFNSNGVAVVMKDGLYGIINSDGKMVVEMEYPKIYDFENGYAYYTKLDKNGKKRYGFVNSDGELSDSTYDGLRAYTPAGYAIVKLNGKYGVVGDGAWQTSKIIFDGIEDFKGDSTLALLNASFGLINEYGTFTPYNGKIDWDTVITAMKGDGLTPVKKFRKYGYINDAGELIIPCGFDNFTKFENGLALIKLGDKFGIINSKSQLLGKIEYEAFKEVKNGVFTVKKEGRWGTVDKTGVFKKELTAEELAEQKNNAVDLEGSIYDTYNKMQEEEAKRNEVVYVAPKDLIELNFTEAKKVGTTEKLFDFTKVDTLFYKNGDKQLAFIKEGEKFATVNGYLKTYNGDETPAKGGFTMNKIEKVNGKYDILKDNNTLPREKFDDYSKGFIINSFVKDKDGYMACSPLELDFFDLEGNMLKSYQSSTHILVSATAIPGTNKYVVLGVRGVNKAPSYNEKRGQIFGISIFDKDLESFSEFVEIRDMYNERWYINSLSTKVLITPDKEILVSFKRIDANGKRSDGFGDDQHISKLDLDKLVDENKIEYLWHVQFENFCLRNFEITSDGTMKGLLYTPGNDDLASFTANSNAKTKAEFVNSIKCNKTVKGSDQISYTTEGCYPLKNGKWITVGQGEIDYGYSNTIVLCYYDSDMSLIRQYRIPNKFNDFHLKELKYDFRLNSQFGYFGQDQDGSSAFGGITGLKRPNMETNSKDFHEMNFENCTYQIIPGETENEIYLMTAYAIMKIDLTKFVECKLKGKIPDYSSDSSDDSSDDSDDSNSSSNSSSTSSSGKSNTSSSTKTNSTSTSTEKEFSGNVYFKYDMSGKDRPGEKLYIHSGSNASSITSTTPGSKATVKCEKGKVYYSFTGKKADMKLIKEMSIDDCGKTINYTDF